MKQAPRRPRTVGLDKPCSKCGAVIHHSYVGPVEGVCGRCSDTRRKKRVRTRRIGMNAGPRVPKGRSTASNILLVGAAMVAGAAAVVFVLSKLMG